MHGIVDFGARLVLYVFAATHFAVDAAGNVLTGIADFIQGFLDRTFCFDNRYFEGFTFSYGGRADYVRCRLKRFAVKRTTHFLAFMGSSDSKQDNSGDNNDTAEEFTETGGFHIIELHLPSVGTGSLLIIAAVGLAAGAWFLRRRAKRAKAKKLQRKVDRKYEERVEKDQEKERSQRQTDFSPKAAVASFGFPLYEPRPPTYGMWNRLGGDYYGNDRFEDITELEQIAAPRNCYRPQGYGRNQALAALAPPPAPAHVPNRRPADRRPRPVVADPDADGLLPAARGLHHDDLRHHDAAADRALDAAAAAAVAPPPGADGNRDLGHIV